MEINKSVILKNLDIEEEKAEQVALAMNLVGIGEIKEMAVETQHEFGTAFTVVDHLGYSYYMTLNWVDNPAMIFEEPSGRILLDTEHSVVRKRGEE